jgi:hypothetical protein
MNATLAARIGRPDLVGIPADPYGGSSGVMQVGAMGSPASGATVMAGLEGRLTAGVLMGALFVVAAFYVWTRGVQA